MFLKENPEHCFILAHGLKTVIYEKFRLNYPKFPVVMVETK